MWEILLVPGASVDGVGVVLRIHHAIADGMAAVAIAQQLFDRDEGSAPLAAVAATAEPPPAARAAQHRRAVRLQSAPHQDDPERP